MAKRKVKLPLKRALDRAIAGATAQAADRKAKSGAKGKKSASLPPGEGPLAVRRGALKLKRKRGRSEGKAPAAAPGPGRSDAAAVAPARPRKLRPAAPLGRLERLEIALHEVRIGARASPRTRKLMASGLPKMAQKVIEEAAEVAIEAIRGDPAALVHEAVDLFYNLLVLSAEAGVPLASIWAEMDRREAALGMAEKLPKPPDP